MLDELSKHLTLTLQQGSSAALGGSDHHGEIKTGPSRRQGSHSLSNTLIDGYKLLMTYGSEKNIVLNTVYVLKWFGTNLSLQFLEHLLYLIVVRAPAPNLIQCM